MSNLPIAPIEEAINSIAEVEFTEESAEIGKKAKKEKRVYVGSLDPARIAKLFLGAAGVDNLKYHKDTWWFYTGRSFETIDDTDLEATLTKFVQNTYIKQHAYVVGKVDEDDAPFIAPRPLKKPFIKDVLGSLKAETLLVANHQMPLWVGDGDRHSYIAFDNGLVEISDLLTNDQVTLQDHTPWWFSANYLPFTYDAQATCPEWTAFLTEVLEEDEDRIKLLQEWFGYCLLPDTRQHRFMLMEGLGANGKSVIVNVLSGLLGQNNVSSVPIESFSNNFALAITYGKLLNVCSEASKVSQHTEGLLKSFVGGDLLTVDRKHKEALTFNPTASSRPQWESTSGSASLASRMLTLTLDRIDEMITLELSVSSRLDFRRRFFAIAGPPQAILLRRGQFAIRIPATRPTMRKFTPSDTV
jgi:putative DNA primase/helicase